MTVEGWLNQQYWWWNESYTSWNMKYIVFKYYFKQHLCLNMFDFSQVMSLTVSTCMLIIYTHIYVYCKLKATHTETLAFHLQTQTWRQLIFNELPATLESFMADKFQAQKYIRVMSHECLCLHSLIFGFRHPNVPWSHNHYNIVRLKPFEMIQSLQFSLAKPMEIWLTWFYLLICWAICCIAHCHRAATIKRKIRLTWLIA